MFLDLVRLSFAHRHPETGVLLLRLFVGFVLIFGTQDNVFSSERMIEFRDFLERHAFRYPLLCAYVSAYAQFTAGILFVLGAATRHAALVMLVNFGVALAMVHVGLPFSANIAPLAMLVCALFFLLHGPGNTSIDAWMASRERRGVKAAAGSERPASQPEREDRARGAVPG